MEIGNKYAGFIGWFGGLGIGFEMIKSPPENIFWWLWPIGMCFLGTCWWKYGFDFSYWFKKY